MKAVLAVLAVLALAAPSALASSVWTVNCDPLTIQRSDPIITPGIASSHVHAVVGGTAFQRTMGNDTATNAQNTTCDKYTDHSNYWCPQLYKMDAGLFYLVPFLGANMYYKNYTCDYHPSGQCATPSEARAFPEGFRMLAGDTTRRTYNDSDQTNQAILFTSGTQYNVHTIPTSLGGYLQGAVRFPSCWDGVHVDSANHKSHVAYPDPALGGNTEGGMCPLSHPYALISIGAEFGFDLSNVTNMSSLVFANGDTTGYGFHADFVQGWQNSSALQASFANCFDNGECPWRAFGSPSGQDYEKQVFSPEVPAIYEEQIGLNGLITSLPGNNPVYVAPRS